MTIREIIESKGYRSVVNGYRDICLWFANNVEYPCYSWNKKQWRGGCVSTPQIVG